MLRRLFSGRIIFLSTPSARRATFWCASLRLSRSYFYPRPPRGGRRFTSFQWFLSILKFLSTPSARRATMLVRVKVVRIIQFLSTPSARRATCGPARLAPAGRYFYPRPPRGGRRVRVAGEFPRQEFLSTPSARRATLQGQVWQVHRRISIHALREEGDSSGSTSPATRPDFYPRPPRGGRLSTKGIPAAAFRFLSTPSARRATCPQRASPPQPFYFYPRPPRGGRRYRNRSPPSSPRFLSTPSARRATRGQRTFHPEAVISIHALREEGDQSGPRKRPRNHDFYPRPPRGGRPSTAPSASSW